MHLSRQFVTFYCNWHLYFHRVWLVSLMVLALVIGYVPESRAEQPLILTDTQYPMETGIHASILEDPDSELSIQDITSESIAKQFVAANKPVPSFGFSRSAFWARWSVIVPPEYSGTWLLELSYAPTQWIDVYHSADGMSVSHLQGGSMVPFSQRPFPHHTHVFPLSLKAGKNILHVRIAGEASKSFPVRMMRYDAFSRDSHSQLLALGAYFGCIAALLLYNLFIYVTVREHSYLFYVLFLLSYILIALNLTGLSQGLIWERWPELSTRTIPLTIGVLGIFGGLFTMSFLTRTIHERNN